MDQSFNAQNAFVLPASYLGRSKGCMKHGTPAQERTIYAENIPDRVDCTHGRRYDIGFGMARFLELELRYD